MYISVVKCGELILDRPVRPVSGIIYASRRALCDSIAARLNSDGIEAAAYHAGLDPKDREKVLDAWVDGRSLGVVVATVAFGMGVDKADVLRFPDESNSRYALLYIVSCQSQLKVRSD